MRTGDLRRQQSMSCRPTMSVRQRVRETLHKALRPVELRHGTNDTFACVVHDVQRAGHTHGGAVVQHVAVFVVLDGDSILLSSSGFGVCPNTSYRPEERTATRSRHDPVGSGYLLW